MSSVDFLSMAVGGIKGLQPYQPGKPIEELERELGISNIVKLASNENPCGPSPKVLEVIAEQAKEITRYPDGFSLTQKLSEKLMVKPEQITLGNGSNQVLNLIAQVFLDARYNAVISQHAFVVYPLAVKALGATLKEVPAKNWGHDLDAMLEAVDENTRLIFIANPNNPTGTWNTADEIQAFMKKVPDNVVVVIDEAYVEYVTDSRYKSAMALLEQYDNLIVTRTFSKAYGLAGLRIGYGVSSPEVADLLNRIREPFNANSLALAAAEVALDDHEYIEKSQRLNHQGMEQLEKGFADLGLKFIPSIGNFICVEFEHNAMEVYDQLLHKGVIVRPIGVYGMPKHLRVSIGLPDENQRCLSALQEILK